MEKLTQKPTVINFSLEEFIIDECPRIAVSVADKIWRNHIVPLQIIRDLFGKPIIISERSGYRKPDYEQRKGRSGGSEHTFKGLGAVDITTHTLEDLDVLEELIIAHSPYTRVCRYNTFIHCDYKAQDGYKYLFTSGSDSKWKQEKRTKIK